MLAKQLIQKIFILFCLPLVLSACFGNLKAEFTSFKGEELKDNFYGSPANIFIGTGQTKKLTFVNAQEPLVYRIVEGYGKINELGEFTSLATGLTTVATTDARGRIAYTQIDSTDIPRFYPNEIKILTNQELQLIVGGGRPPYSYFVDSGNGAVGESTGIFTAPSAQSDVVVRVVDVNGLQSKAKIYVRPPPSFTNSNLTIQAGATIANSFSGGFGSLTMSAQAVGLSVNGSTGEITSGLTNGNALVMAQDVFNNKALQTVAIRNGSAGAGFRAESFLKKMGAGQLSYITVTGGTPPYSMQLKAGSGSLDQSLMSFTTPQEISTEYEAEIEVSDSSTPTVRKSTVRIPVYKLVTSLSSTTLEPGAEATISVTSTLSGIVFKSYRGSISNSVYRAPSEYGYDLVEIKDEVGNKTQTLITIADKPRVTPSETTVALGSVIQIFPKDLATPVSFNILSGSALFDQRGYVKVLATSPPVVIESTDASGQKFQSILNVASDFIVTPGNDKVTANQTITFNLSGGGLPYAATLIGSNPLGTLQLQSSSSFSYKAPATVGSDFDQQIQFLDALGNLKTITIKVVPLMSLMVTASPVQLGDAVEFEVSGGVPPYQLSIDSSSLGEIEQLAVTKFKLLPTSVGSFSGQVADGSGTAIQFGPIVIATSEITTATAAVTGSPTGTSKTVNLDLTVSGTNITHYKYKIGTSTLDCGISTDYTDAIDVNLHITDSIVNMSDGAIKVCVIGKNSSGVWQSLSLATAKTWTKDTIAPTVTISSPLVNSIVTGLNQSSINFTGTCSETGLPVQVTALENTTQFFNETVSCVGGQFVKNFNLTTRVDGSFKFSVSQQDSPGNLSSTKSVTIYKDTMAPSAPSMPEDGLFSGSLDKSPGLSWVASSDDGGTGIDYYQVAIGTTAGGTDIKTWTTVGNVQTAQITSLSLQNGITYYFSVKAVDKAGYESNSVSSDGWTVVTGEPLAVRFIDSTSVNYSIPVTSAAVIVQGIASPRNVSVSGTGNPQVSLNGTDFFNSVMVSDGNSLYVRLSSAATGSTSNYASVAIGDYVAPRWIVTTQPSTLEFSQATSTLSETAGSTAINISISPATTSTISLELAITGTATAGTDHNLVSQTVTIPANTTSFPIAIDPSADSLVEGSESVILTLSSLNGANFGTKNVHTVTLSDNNLTPLKVTDFSPKFGVSAGGYTLTLNGTGFVSGTTVTIGNNNCGTINIVSATQMTCTVPVGTAGQAALVRLVRSGDAAQTDANQYFYYSKASAQWADVATTNGPSSSQITAVWTGSKVIAWGGSRISDYSNSGAMYDPVANSWTLMAATTLSPRIAASALWHNGKVYIFGGTNSSEKFSDLVAFDPILNDWSYLISAPIPGVHQATMVLNNNKLVIFGGLSQDGPRADLITYDISQKNWSISTAVNFPAARYGHVGVATSFGLFVFGGKNESIVFNDGGLYDFTNDTWQTNQDTVARAFTSAVVIGNEVLLWGGLGSGGALNSGARYNPSGNSFTSIATSGAPEARVNHSAISTGSRLIVFGGSTGLLSGNTMNSGGIYNPSNNTWSSITSTLSPSPRAMHVGLWLDGTMFIWSGQSALSGNSLLSNGRVFDPGP